MDKKQQELVRAWLDGGRDFAEGAALYAQLGKSNNLKQKFAKANVFTLSKLPYQLATEAGIKEDTRPAKVGAAKALVVAPIEPEQEPADNAADTSEAKKDAAPIPDAAQEPAAPAAETVDNNPTKEDPAAADKKDAAPTPEAAQEPAAPAAENSEITPAKKEPAAAENITVDPVQYQGYLKARQGDTENVKYLREQLGLLEKQRSGSHALLSEIADTEARRVKAEEVTTLTITITEYVKALDHFAVTGKLPEELEKEVTRILAAEKHKVEIPEGVKADWDLTSKVKVMGYLANVNTYITKAKTPATKEKWEKVKSFLTEIKDDVIQF